MPGNRLPNVPIPSSTRKKLAKPLTNRRGRDAFISFLLRQSLRNGLFRHGPHDRIGITIGVDAIIGKRRLKSALFILQAAVIIHINRAARLGEMLQPLVERIYARGRGQARASSS